MRSAARRVMRRRRAGIRSSSNWTRDLRRAREPHRGYGYASAAYSEIASGTPLRGLAPAPLAPFGIAPLGIAPLDLAPSDTASGMASTLSTSVARARAANSRTTAQATSSAS